MLVVEVQRGPPWPPEVDWDGLARLAAEKAALEGGFQTLVAGSQGQVEISVRFTTDVEVQSLNRDYRSRDKATNVLSFPMLRADEIAALKDGFFSAEEIMLGDVVLAHETCVHEAGERGIAVADHAAHLLVHGTLHLLGYDHETGEAEAEAMEAAERRALASLGIADPYSLPLLQD